MDLFWPIAATRWLHLGALLILFGAPFFTLYDARQAEGTKTYVWLAGIALLSGCCWLVLSLTDMTDGVESLSSLTTWRAFFRETSFGSVWALRLALLLALQACTVVASLQPSKVVVLTVCTLSAALLVSSAWLGHAAAARGFEWSIGLASYACHVLGAGAWLGGLLPLSQTLRRSGDSAILQASLERFSRMGMTVVGLIVASGILNAYFRSVTLGGLITTEYGRILAVKLALFSVLLGLAAANRWILLPRLHRNGNAAQTLHSLYRSVVFEQVLGAGIVAVAVVLGATPPTE